MSDMTYLIAGICAGGTVAGAMVWAISKARHGARAVSLESSLSEVRAQLEGRITEVASIRAELDSMRSARADAAARLELLEKMEKGLSESFKSASMDALSKNTEEFMKYAEKALIAQKDLGSKDLSGKKELIDQSIEGMTRKLGDVQRKIEEIGLGNMEKMGEVSHGIKQHIEATSRLAETADGLRQTLASAKKRGEWGERMAEDVIRLAGMVEGINYTKQKTLDHAAGRPDYTFFLPNKLMINMDVKFPMDNYINFLEAASDPDRKRFREELIKNVRIMMKSLASRDYINPSGHTVDYVLMFIPNEQVYSFINESDVTLMDEALRSKVILCSPFTLYAVLAVIRQAVENFSLEETASEILNLLSEFNKQWDKYRERFQTLGNRLEQARREYEALDSTRANQLERPLRKIEELRKQKSIPIEGQPHLD